MGRSAEHRTAIISAMREEIDAILGHQNWTKEDSSGMRSFYTGQWCGHEVVMGFSRWGKVAAATSLSHMIHHYKIDQVIFTGVAGALDPKVNIGDVVLAGGLYQHDLDASPILSPLEVPLLGKTHFEADSMLNEALADACQRFLKAPEAYISQQVLNTFGVQEPQLHRGAIASGDQFVSTKAQIERIKSLIPDALCAEMEGAAIAQVCYEYKIPFAVVRTISDKADDNAKVDFPAFAKEVASYYALGILNTYFEGL